MSKHWTPAKSELEAELGGLSINDVTDETKLVSARLHNPVKTSQEVPLVQPIVHSSTFKVKDHKHYADILKEGGYIYLRLGSPTCSAAEVAINLLEGGAGSVVFGSGMAAISATLLSFLKSGDHLVSCYPLYSGSYDLMITLKERYNVDVTFVGYDVDEYRKALRPNTKVLYGETPSNPVISVQDMEKFGALGKSLKDVVTIVDATYASPYLLKPIQYGVDIVLHSATKYLGGHSDLCAGVVTTSTVDQWKDIMKAKTRYGGILSPYEASLLIRGLKTLHLRVSRQSDTALQLAEFLQGHPKVEQVFYPGLKSHPGHEVAKRQMKKFGGMITFEVKGGLEAAKTFIQSIRVIHLAVSLGGVESLVEHAASMSHGPMVMSDEQRAKGQITDGQIRFSVGLEDVDDLRKDLQRALDKIVLH